MIHTLPTVNWTTGLAEAIENAQDGDIVQVRNQDQVELGQRALLRMAPEKRITFQIDVDYDTRKSHYTPPC